MADASEIAKLAAEVTYRSTGTQSAFTAKLQSFTALATMGSYRASDAARAELHDALDALLDASLDMIKLNRQTSGLE